MLVTYISFPVLPDVSVCQQFCLFILQLILNLWIIVVQKFLLQHTSLLVSLCAYTPFILLHLSYLEDQSWVWVSLQRSLYLILNNESLLKLFATLYISSSFKAYDLQLLFDFGFNYWVFFAVCKISLQVQLIETEIEQYDRIKYLEDESRLNEA